MYQWGRVVPVKGALSVVLSPCSLPICTILLLMIPSYNWRKNVYDDTHVISNGRAVTTTTNTARSLSQAVPKITTLQRVYRGNERQNF